MLIIVGKEHTGTENDTQNNKDIKEYEEREPERAGEERK